MFLPDCKCFTTSDTLLPYLYSWSLSPFPLLQCTHLTEEKRGESISLREKNYLSERKEEDFSQRKKDFSHRKRDFSQRKKTIHLKEKRISLKENWIPLKGEQISIRDHSLSSSAAQISKRREKGSSPKMSSEYMPLPVLPMTSSWCHDLSCVTHMQRSEAVVSLGHWNEKGSTQFGFIRNWVVWATLMAALKFKIWI